MREISKAHFHRFRERVKRLYLSYEKSFHFSSKLVNLYSVLSAADRFSFSIWDRPLTFLPRKRLNHKKQHILKFLNPDF